jgi:hypothetical protein
MPFNLVLKYLGALIDTTDENVAIEKMFFTRPLRRRDVTRRE